MGMGISSVFAVGSMGTLVVGLATQDTAKMLVSGLALSLSGRMNEGDKVQLEDGTSGFVDKLGWMQTTIRGYDELIQVVRFDSLLCSECSSLLDISPHAEC